MEYKYIERVADALVLILNKNNDNYTQEKIEFAYHFKAFLEQLPSFISKKETDGLIGNEDMVHSIINYACLLIENSNIKGTEVQCGIGSKNGKGRADIVLSIKGIKTGLIIEMKYNHNAKFAINQIHEKNYYNYFEKSCIAKVLLIGINVDKNKNVEVEIEGWELNKLLCKL